MPLSILPFRWIWKWWVLRERHLPNLFKLFFLYHLKTSTSTIKKYPNKVSLPFSSPNKCQVWKSQSYIWMYFCFWFAFGYILLIAYLLKLKRYFENEGQKVLLGMWVRNNMFKTLSLACAFILVGPLFVYYPLEPIWANLPFGLICFLHSSPPLY